MRSRFEVRIRNNFARLQLNSAKDRRWGSYGLLELFEEFFEDDDEDKSASALCEVISAIPGFYNTILHASYDKDKRVRKYSNKILNYLDFCPDILEHYLLFFLQGNFKLDICRRIISILEYYGIIESKSDRDLWSLDEKNPEFRNEMRSKIRSEIINLLAGHEDFFQAKLLRGIVNKDSNIIFEGLYNENPNFKLIAIKGVECVISANNVNKILSLLIDLTTDEVINDEAINKISSILDYCLDESEEINISDSTLNTLVELCKNKQDFSDNLRYKIYKLSGGDTKYLGKTEEDEKHKDILNLIDGIVDKKAEDKERIYIEQIKKEGYLSYFVSEIFDKCVDIYWRNESDEKDLDYYLSILRLTEEQNRGLVIQEIIKETAYNYKEFMTDPKYYRYISGLYTGIWILEQLFDLSKFHLVLLLFGSDDEYIRASSVIILKNVADTKFEYILFQVLKNEEIGVVRRASIEQMDARENARENAWHIFGIMLRERLQNIGIFPDPSEYIKETENIEEVIQNIENIKKTQEKSVDEKGKEIHELIVKNIIEKNKDILFKLEYPHLKENLGDYLDLLDNDSRLFLATAEHLFNIFKDKPLDCSASCIEYVKVVENVFVNYFLIPFKKWVNRKYKNLGDVIKNDKDLRRLTTFLTSDKAKPLELGTFNYILGILLNERRRENSILLQALYIFIVTYTENPDFFLIKSSLYDSISIITKKYRNPSAHTEPLDFSILEEFRRYIIGDEYPFLFKLLDSI